MVIDNVFVGAKRKTMPQQRRKADYNWIIVSLSEI